MNNNSARVKKYKKEINCKCGITYFGNDFTISNHDFSKAHINNENQLKIKGNDINKRIYDREELRIICSANQIKDYGKLSIEKMINALFLKENVIIPHIVAK